MRSFVSIPAGVFEVPFVRYTLLTLLGSAIWCFAFAGVGYAAGASWEDFHHAFRYVDYVVAAAIVGGVALARLAVPAQRASRGGVGRGVRRAGSSEPWIARRSYTRPA